MQFSSSCQFLIFSIFKLNHGRRFLYYNVYKCVMKNNKTRINITVDTALLNKAKTKLDLFGGKLSTLFNAYLRDFVDTMDKEYSAGQKEMKQKIKELEERIDRLEKGKK